MVVSAADVFDADKGYGFDKPVTPAVQTRCDSKNYYGKPYSPLISGCLGSRKGARFRIAVPDGDYILHVISGAPFPSYDRPSDTLIQSAGQKLLIENFYTCRTLMRGDLPVTAKDGQGITLDISTRTTWVLASMLLYPVQDAAKARLALDDFRRELYRYPMEDHYAKRLWFRIPPEGPDPLPAAEAAQGCAVYRVPAAKPVALWHVPQPEDWRAGPLRALAGPGETANVSLAVHAAKPLSNVTIAVTPPHASVTVTPWVVRQSERPLGRGSLNQWADQPDVIEPLEPADLQPGQNQQFLIGLRPSAQTPPGVHTGAVSVRAEGKEIGRFEIRLSVLPSAPPEDPAFSDGAYYTPFLNISHRSDPTDAQPNWASLTDAEKDIAIRAERNALADLRAHGLNTMHLTMPRGTAVQGPDGVLFNPGDVIPIFMDLLKQTGFTVRPVIFSLQADYDVGGAMLTPEAKRAGVELKQRPDRHLLEGKLSKPFLDGITSLVRQIETERKKRGWPELIYDLWDEPGVPGSGPAHDMYAAIRAAGCKTYLTIVPDMAKIMGDVLDIRLYAGGPGARGGEAETPEQVLAMKKKYGTQWWDYSGGCVRFDRFARNEVAYYWWSWNFDGHCPWKCIKWTGDYRNDYDGWDVHPVVPSSQGMITSTIGWEMARSTSSGARPGA
ncbi:MAG TPA: hypothetical protein P5137_16740, partial [Candidatus Brocadiia bacterium]|nr:hypothetical protein [Candidatus Brocadiia bacterium]